MHVSLRTERYKNLYSIATNGHMETMTTMQQQTPPSNQKGLF